MNNSLDPGPGPVWNGQQGPEHQTVNKKQDPRFILDGHGSASNNSRQFSLNTDHEMVPNSVPGQLNQNSSIQMNLNSGSGAMNNNLGIQPVMNMTSSARPVNDNSGFGMYPNLLQRTAPLNMQTGTNPHQHMNGFQPSSSGPTNVNMSTPSSVGSRFPMWDMDIPSQMFMQAINFEQLMGKQPGGIANMSFGSSAPGNIMNSTRLSEDSQHKSGKVT